MTRLALLVFLLLGAGCTTVANPTVVCPVHVKPWTLAEQSQILIESDKQAEGSILLPVLEDYATMRAEARQCLASE